MRCALLLVSAIVLSACAATPAASSPTPSITTSIPPAASPLTDTQARTAVLKAVTSYEQAIYVAQDPAAAWALLAPYSQGTISPSDWANTMRALSAQSGRVYSIGPPTLDWTVLNYAYVGQEESDIRASADVSRAYALWVRHPGNPSISAGSEGMIVAPLRSGEWRIWLVH